VTAVVVTILSRRAALGYKLSLKEGVMLRFLRTVRERVSATEGRTFSFALGVIASAIVSSYIQDFLKIHIAWLSMVVVLFSAFVFFYLHFMYKKIYEVVEASQIKVDYLHEPYDLDKGFSPTGRLHEALKEFVCKAEHKLWTVAVTWDPDLEQKFYGESSHRPEYLRSIEEKVRGKFNSGFDYIRIVQVPGGAAAGDLRAVLDSCTFEHCSSMARMASELTDRPNTKVGMYKTTKRIAAGFMIVDDRYVLIGLEGTKSGSAESHSLAGLLIVDDRSGSVVQKWSHHFQSLLGSSDRIRSEAWELSGSRPAQTSEVGGSPGGGAHSPM
jgi:hypothetical protein